MKCLFLPDGSSVVDSVSVLQQLLALETTLFLDGLNFYDQHSGMRLDIDNMSYEVCFCFITKMYSSLSFLLKIKQRRLALLDIMTGMTRSRRKDG